MSARPQDPLFDPLPVGHLEAQLDQWVDSFPADALRLQLAELERRRGDIEKAMESLNRRLAYWQAERAHRAGRDDAVAKPSKRDAVLNLLERDPFREFALVEIRSTLVSDGLLDDTPKARHNLEVTVSNMVKRGEIDRPRKGFYKIAAPSGESATPTNLHRAEDDAA